MLRWLLNVVDIRNLASPTKTLLPAPFDNSYVEKTPGPFDDRSPMDLPRGGGGPHNDRYDDVQYADKTRGRYPDSFARELYDDDQQPAGNDQSRGSYDDRYAGDEPHYGDDDDDRAALDPPTGGNRQYGSEDFDAEGRVQKPTYSDGTRTFLRFIF